MALDHGILVRVQVPQPFLLLDSGRRLGFGRLEDEEHVEQKEKEASSQPEEG